MASGAAGRVQFNVGGKLFETTTTTLANAGRDSMLGALLDADWNLRQPTTAAATPEYFLDRNPACFAVLLDLLRTGELYLPPSLPLRLLLREASFFGLLDHVRAALWGPFDGNRLRLSRSVPGTAPGDATAVRAAPDGGCCVVHGSVAHLYDWTFVEQPPLNLDFQQINDAGFVDSHVVVLTARERLGKKGGGMALFSSSTGELRHRFEVRHENHPKSFTAGALSFDNMNSKIFSSCKGRCNEYGIGVWDEVTGEQADFFYEQPGCPLGDADKLQWLNATRCLMVATLFPKTDNCYIGLLDFREKKVVWSWSDEGGSSSFLGEKRVLDVVAIDDNRSVCVVNQYDDLGFMDFRVNGGGVRWSSRSKLMKGRVSNEELCYPRLAAHGGQLFLSMNDSVSVFSGAEWVLTASLKASNRGAICDFSIGGDRLFALHSDENVFDVWEAPPPPGSFL